MEYSKTLLAVLAHPDDESFGIGGTLALYASRGANVYLICATRGEAGTVDPEYLEGFDSTADLREGELTCAAEAIGVKKVFFLDYRDSGMPGSEENKHPDALINHRLDEVAEKIVRYIRELKPDVVLTFDPIGGYRHPDHIHIHSATVLAFDRAADPHIYPGTGAPFQSHALYFNTIPRTLFKAGVWLLRLFGRDPSRWGRNNDIDLVSLVEVDFPVHARIDYRAVADRKEKAGNCHASQGGGQMRRGFVGIFFSLFSGTETFMRAYPPPRSGAKVVKDLFDLAGG